MSFQALLFVASGGALGSALRFLLATWIPSGAFPWATLLANILGCTLIALVTHKGRKVHPHWKSFAMTGFCGSLTTLSLLSFELLTFLQSGATDKALIYFVLSFGLTIPLLYLLGLQEPEVNRVD